MDSIPYLLLTRSVHWRRLLVTGGLSAVGTAVFGVVTAFYMPPLVTRYTNQFGLFGITIALIGWLLVASVIVVAAAAIGAEFDASRAPWAVRLQTRYHLLDPDLEPPVAVPDAAVGLDSSDLVLLLRVLVNWLILTVAVWVATSIVPGIDVPGGFLTLLGVSLLLGLVNAVLGPLLYLVAMPLTVLTLGTFALVVNGVLLSVTAALTDPSTRPASAAQCWERWSSRSSPPCSSWCSALLHAPRSKNPRPHEASRAPAGHTVHPLRVMLPEIRSREGGGERPAQGARSHQSWMTPSEGSSSRLAEAMCSARATRAV